MSRIWVCASKMRKETSRRQEQPEARSTGRRTWEGQEMGGTLISWKYKGIYEKTEKKNEQQKMRWEKKSKQQRGSGRPWRPVKRTRKSKRP